MDPLASSLLHVRMRVNDLEKTVRFYREVLGLTEVRRSLSPRGSKIAFLKAKDSATEIEIAEFGDSGAVFVPPDLVHLAFRVRDLEETLARLRALNIPVTEGPTESSRSVFLFIDAPEGYEIELIAERKSPGKTAP